MSSVGRNRAALQPGGGSTVSALATGISFPRRLLLMMVFACVTAVAAHVRVPLPTTDVPFTLQTYVVLAAGLLLTPATAVGAMVLYVLAGSVLAATPSLGVSFFANSAGLTGVTGGYLVGFAAAVWTMSALRGAWATPGSLRDLAFRAALGTMIIFACGALWMAVLFGRPWPVAWLTGVQPFLLESFLKAVAAG